MTKKIDGKTYEFCQHNHSGNEGRSGARQLQLLRLRWSDKQKSLRSTWERLHQQGYLERGEEVKSIDRRITDAYYQTEMCTGKTPTQLFLGKKEIEMLNEFSERMFKIFITEGKVPNQKTPKIGTIMGMTIHEVNTDSLIATGWPLD